jgi:hypothetical protein
LWDNYVQFYEEAINRTSMPQAPWYIVPADNKETGRYIVAKTILDELEKYTDIQEPQLDEAIKENINSYKKLLEVEK